MAMYFMSGKTFLTQYINEDLDKVWKTQFVIVSSTIKKSGKYEKKKRMINANKILFPKEDLIVDYKDYRHNDVYKSRYYDQLDDNKVFLATLIKFVIEKKVTIVFLCGEREKKYAYFDILQDYLEDEFNFHIYNYKKYKEGKEKVFRINSSLVLKKCDKLLKKAKKDNSEKAMASDYTRMRYIKSLSKKELKKELKRRSLYSDGMTRTEMEEILDVLG